MRSSSPNDGPARGRALKLGPAEWYDLIIAALELGRARLTLRRATSPELFRVEPVDSTPARQPPQPEIRVERVRTAIARMGHRVPWRADCLVQAIAAQHWLNRHGLKSRIAIGVRERGQDPFQAHAWLMCGDIAVTGGDIAEYVPLHPRS